MLKYLSQYLTRFFFTSEFLCENYHNSSKDQLSRISNYLPKHLLHFLEDDFFLENISFLTLHCIIFNFKTPFMKTTTKKKLNQ